MKPNDKCWWYHSKQCQDTSCSTCFVFYPVLKGMLETPSYELYHMKKLYDMLRAAEKTAIEKYGNGKGGSHGRTKYY